MNVINNSSKPEETCVEVSKHITRCFSVAAQFTGCREKLIEMPELIRDLCRILYFKVILLSLLFFNNKCLFLWYILETDAALLHCDRVRKCPSARCYFTDAIVEVGGLVALIDVYV